MEITSFKKCADKNIYYYILSFDETTTVNYMRYPFRRFRFLIILEKKFTDNGKNVINFAMLGLSEIPKIIHLRNTRTSEINSF